MKTINVQGTKLTEAEYKADLLRRDWPVEMTEVMIRRHFTAKGRAKARWNTFFSCVQGLLEKLKFTI